MVAPNLASLMPVSSGRNRVKAATTIFQVARPDSQVLKGNGHFDGSRTRPRSAVDLCGHVDPAPQAQPLVSHASSLHPRVLPVGSTGGHSGACGFIVYFEWDVVGGTVRC